MKVAHVTLYPPRNEKHVRVSGVASYSKNLITSIPNASQEVVCDIVKSSEKYNDESIIIHRSFKRNPSFIISVHRTLRRIDPDVVHIQQELALFGNVITAVLLQWLVWWWREKVVITIHGVVDPSKIDRKFVEENNSHLPVWMVRIAFRVIYTPLMKWARRVIVHEPPFKETAIRKYGIAAHKIDIVPHGVEALSVVDRPLARRTLGLDNTAKAVLFMGYVTGYKGIDLLIEGFAEFVKTEPEAYLIIGAGKHPKLHNNAAYLREYRRLQEKAKKLISSDSYRWVGFIDEAEVACYYSASDVSVYPYTTAMSSSGPMSFAIGYEKPFLVSTAFEDIFAAHPQLLFNQTAESLKHRLVDFFANQNHYRTVSSMLKQSRTWQSVGKETARIYQQIGE